MTALRLRIALVRAACAEGMTAAKLARQLGWPVGRVRREIAQGLRDIGSLSDALRAEIFGDQLSGERE